MNSNKNIMLKKLLIYIVASIVILALAGIIMWLPSSASRDTVSPDSYNNYTISKIDFHSSGTSNENPDWSNVSGRIIAFDDSGNIYILGADSMHINIYNQSGSKTGAIELKFPEKLTKAFNLSISGDGQKIYTGASVKAAHEQMSRSNLITYVFDRNGMVQKEILRSNMWLIRTCDGNFIDRPWGPAFITDENLEAINPYKDIIKHYDSEGDYIITGEQLAKYTPFGYPLLRRFTESADDVIPFAYDLMPFIDKVAWKRPLPNYAEAIYDGIGFDYNDNYYASDVSGKDGKRYLIRIDKNGSINAVVEITRDMLTPPFLGDAEDLYDGPGDMPFFNFYVSCEGAVYLIYNMPKLSTEARQIWFEKNSYMIYKIEMN